MGALGKFLLAVYANYYVLTTDFIYLFIFALGLLAILFKVYGVPPNPEACEND